MAPVQFKEADVSRALKGARKAGFAVGRVEIGKDGSITLVASSKDRTGEPVNEWDQVLKDVG